MARRHRARADSGSSARGRSGCSLVDLRRAFVFPPVNVAVTLVGTIVLALLVLLAPVRRAVRFKPGEALRHA